jgi:N utilization substance protein B
MARLYRRGRTRAFQALFEAEFGRIPANAALKRPSGERLSEAELAFATTLVAGVQKHRSEIDEIITETAPTFPIGQIAMVDRTLLRIALYEVLFNNAAVPIGAAINDAVELAKTFGSDASRRFVNGVLGTVSRQRLPDSSPKPPPNRGAALQEALAAPKAETEEPHGAL